MINPSFDFVQEILEERFLIRDKHNLLKESSDQLFWRVACAVAKAEKNWGNQTSVNHYAAKFYSIMRNHLFLPNSPTLMNAGTANQYLSACFVFPLEDHREGIFSTLDWAKLTHQNGGGTGFNFSEIRPAGDFINEKSKSATGPLSVLELFNHATEQIKQRGKRRGANMGILNVDHPDIYSFISSKSMGNKLRNFNLSVGIKDKFMHAVGKNTTWDLINPRNQKVSQTVLARDLWREIVKNAWKCGDPGLIFLDAINRANPVPGTITSTNPCGEAPLLPFESCNLGSVNVAQLFKESIRKRTVDWTKLEKVVSLGIRFLDNVIEVNSFIDDKVRTATLANRKVGLGIMGWADLLINLRIPYASTEAVKLGQKLMKFVAQISKEASCQLGKERGNFPNWESSIFFPVENMRNATRNSIAPTGTISIIAQTSASIEPIFALFYYRKSIKEEKRVPVIHPLFLEYLKARSLNTKKILQEVSLSGTCINVPELSKEEKEWFQTALEIDPKWHLRHQIAFQNFTDNAVSKTINLPESTTIDQVMHIFQKAWKFNLKGITVFRNNSKNDQVMMIGLEREMDSCLNCLRFQ